ncbi:PLC-like phosphodiesterase [Hypoxylon argillaceum]|nr:PLC-like phosphodiesterase [Hypoxylon argillaceum]
MTGLRDENHRLPHAIGHRGYRAAFPENTIASFRGAVEVGATVIEADIHLSKDGVVVLSHDATLKRCFGQKAKISEYDWDYLSTLLTLREPRQPMPRLIDLLRYLARPTAEDIWLLVDIKTDDDATTLLTALAAAIASVPASKTPWNERIMLGSWVIGFRTLIKACLRNLPSFPVALIAFSPDYASAMLAVPNLNFNLFDYSFATARGSKFKEKARENSRLTFSWSDNKDQWMALSIRDGVDGVITDNPKRFMDLCEKWTSEEASKSASRGTLPQSVLWLFINFLVWGTEIISTLLIGSPRRRVIKALSTQVLSVDD